MLYIKELEAFADLPVQRQTSYISGVFFFQGAEKSLKAALYAKNANLTVAVQHSHCLRSIAIGIYTLLFMCQLDVLFKPFY